MSKTSRIRSWLRSGRALNRFGCMRLAARIHEFRAEGLPIVTERVMRNGTIVARYRMART
jgi:hypothetical protein